MSTHKDAKAMARLLRAAMAERNISLRHSECLEIVARQFGFADWNTLSAKLPAEERPLTPLRVPELPPPTAETEMVRAAAPEQLCCSFCRKPQHEVRSLIEGGCSRPRRAPENCVFICDECVTFCAQVNNGSDPDLPSPSIDGDGRRTQ
jgi:hypothetical protein